MSYEEKGTWQYLVISVAGYVVYLALVLPRIADTPVGEVAYIVPDRKLARFVLIAPRDAARFLAVVAAARRNFLVVEQRTGGVRDYVAVYDFDRAAAEALLACRQRHGS